MKSRLLNYVTASPFASYMVELVGDYGSYRRQLSRRLLVVRKKLNCACKSRKYAAKPPITAEDIGRNHEFIHLLLLSSERAWAQAMHVKVQRATEPGSEGLKGSSKIYILSRLTKAARFAGHLVNLLKEKGLAKSRTEDILEARAYYVGLIGACSFEKQTWGKAAQQYSEARVIYMALATSKGLDHEDLFRDLLSTTVDPNLRYSAYRLKLPRTLSLDAIVTRNIPQVANEYLDEALKINQAVSNDPESDVEKPRNEQAGSVPKTIQWRSREVSIEDASIAQALGAVAAAEATLTTFLSLNQYATRQAKAAAYDQVLIPSQDAVDATKTAIDELSAEGVAQGDRQMQSLQITNTAVNYSLIKWRIGRNRILCGKRDGTLFESESIRPPKRGKRVDRPKTGMAESTGHKVKRLKENIVLYDASLQSLDAAGVLPGVAADEAFLKELESQRAYFSALRCLSIARSHALLHNYREALALLSSASKASSKALSESSLASSASAKPPNIEVTRAQATLLDELLNGLVIHYRALVELSDSRSASTVAAEKDSALPPFVERLNEYPLTSVNLANLVRYPPNIEPVPVKPLFLDIAYNYIEYPGRRQPVSSQNVNGVADSGADKEEKHGSKRGWFGFGR